MTHWCIGEIQGEKKITGFTFYFITVIVLSEAWMETKKAHTYRHIKPQPQKPLHLCCKQEKMHVNEINENDNFTMSGSNDRGMTSRLRDYITDSQPPPKKTVVE